MNARPIQEKIEADAREAAQQIAQDAREKADALRRESNERMERAHEQMLAQAQRDGEELEQRMLRMSELDERKALLSRKRALIDEAFALAHQKLQAVSAPEKRAFFLAQIVKSAEGSERLIVGAEGDAWFDPGFLADANDALKSAGKPGMLTLAEERRVGCEGLILSARGAENNCTLESLLDAVRSEMETRVAAILFA